MSERKWTYRVRHMLQAIDEINAYTRGLTYEAFCKNRQTQRAVERCFEIMGEAAVKVPDTVKRQYPDIPWPKITGMRHFVIHEYDMVQEEVLWNTVKNDLEPLRQQLLIVDLPEGE